MENLPEHPLTRKSLFLQGCIARDTAKVRVR